MKGEKAVIVLAGMIGAGKTTYTKYISEALESEAFYESVDNNPILEKYYANQERWAFALQVYFLNTRFASIKQALTHQNNVLDRSIYEDALFTRINYEKGYMSEEEMAIYLNLLDNMLEELQGMPKKAPDLLVFLRGSFEKHLEHISSRGRDYEQDEELLAYFKLLHSRYEQWFNDYHVSEKIVFNIDEIDMENEQDRAYVIDTIKQKLAEIHKI